MKNKVLPLKEISISGIYNDNKATYEVPIYQRNYAWNKDEIYILIQDIFDAFENQKNTYYIGTLVSYNKGDNVYEVIDGQQRLTTIYLVLKSLDVEPNSKLTYRARKKSMNSINSIPDFNVDEIDNGIKNGYMYAKSALEEIVGRQKLEAFKAYFLKSVRIIHYNVPKDIDLNHYFEIMNSRGEQLEKHEIIKARLIEKLSDNDRAKFSLLWETCSEMNVFIKQKYKNTEMFGDKPCDFKEKSFDKLPDADSSAKLKISDILNSTIAQKHEEPKEKIDSFQPIIDFSNFLLIVLKLTRMEETGFVPTEFNLDDKELINEFDKVNVIDDNFVKKFALNLLRAKFFLDSYIAHHSNEEDKLENNPWKLQYWHEEDKKTKKGYLKNLCEDPYVQDKLVQLLSMFEVSFTARQRKNYLFYCLQYLFAPNNPKDYDAYCKFLTKLAEKYVKDIYCVRNNLSESNVPKPGSFDDSLIKEGGLCLEITNTTPDFTEIFGDGTVATRGIPLFVFNYLDYKLWEKYQDELRGEKQRESRQRRRAFFDSLGCEDFGQKIFDYFYFSRTRRSLEHYYPQAMANEQGSIVNENQANCFGNFAMIGSEMNSSGSNWSPATKLDHYLDASGKIKQISVASLKFMIMMQKCKENRILRPCGTEWDFNDIKAHQAKMIEILFNHRPHLSR